MTIWNWPTSSAHAQAKSAYRWTSTIYNLEFLPSARKEWDKLVPSIREQFAKKLRERLGAPHIPSAKLSDMPGCYKVKLRAAGYRLVYRVDDGRVTVIIVAVGRRDRNLVYKLAAGRIT